MAERVIQKHIDNFPLLVEEIHYTTLKNISDISMALTDKQLIQFLVPLVKDKILELTKVIYRFLDTDD